MSKPAKTIYYFGFIMIAEVIVMLWSPSFLLQAAGLAPSDAVWLRVIGGIVGGLTIYYFMIARHEIASMFIVPVYERSLVFIVITALYLFNNAHFAVFCVGVLDLLGALWTFSALKSASKS